MKKLLSLVLLLPFSIAFAQQEPGDVLEISLDEAISTALANNQAHRNAALDIEYAENQVDEVRSMGLPQVNGNVNFTHNLEIATQVFPDFISPSVYGVLIQEGLVQPDPNRSFGSFPAQFGVPYSLQATVGMQQLIFDGTFFLGLKAASEFVNVSQLLLSKSAIDVKEGVYKAYYMALISEQNLGQLEKSLENLQKLKKETQELYDAGYAEQLDVDRLVLSVSQVEININNLQNQAELTKKLLLNSMGLDVNQEISLTTALPEFDETTFSPEFVESADLSNRIEIQILEQQQALNELDLKRYQVGYIPTIYLNANYGFNTFGQKDQFDQLGNEWFGLSSYSLSLSIPIFDGLYKKSKADQARVDILKTTNSLEQAKNGIALEIAQAQTTYRNAYRNLEIQKKNIELSESIYNTTKIKFQEGVGSSFEMVNAERDLTIAQTNYLNALYELSVAKINLDKAYGNL
ncbi:TolC family protein [bacterium]|nr:TolC family protein [bacterium]